jgi:hypothetical protein
MIHHVYSYYKPKNPQTARRMNLAKRSWDRQPWNDLPVKDEMVRCFQDAWGKVPYIKDIIDHGCKAKDPEDIIVLTNADICVSSDCCFKIVAAFQSIRAAYCFRRDFKHLTTLLPDPIIKKGQHYCGSDLYAFRVGWWKFYREEFPDMLLGREAWDAVLRILIEMSHPNQNPTLYDLIYHERHASVWENPIHRRTIPSQLHNIRLARTWMLSFGKNPASIGI